MDLQYAMTSPFIVNTLNGHSAWLHGAHILEGGISSQATLLLILLPFNNAKYFIRRSQYIH